MKKHCLTVGLLVIWGAALATAQSRTTEPEKDARNTTKADTVIVTGCVAQSPDGKSYTVAIPATGHTRTFQTRSR